MERLTYFDGGKWRMRIGDTEYSGYGVDRFAAYESTGMEPEDILSAKDMAKIACALHELNQYKELGDIDRLRELVEADRDGRCFIAPIKVGERVFLPNDKKRNNRVQSAGYLFAGARKKLNYSFGRLSGGISLDRS